MVYHRTLYQPFFHKINPINKIHKIQYLFKIKNIKLTNLVEIKSFLIDKNFLRDSIVKLAGH